MKRKLFLAIAIGVMTLTACNKEDMGNISLGNETISAILTDETAQTRTALNGLQVVWSENDRISVFAENGNSISNNAGTIKTGTGTTSATFDVVLEGTTKLAAAYPYMPGTTYSDGKITMTLPDSYTYVENGIGGAPMAAIINNQTSTVAFKNAGALMGLTVNNIPAGYNQAILTSKGEEAITGVCEITFDTDGKPSIEATSAATGKVITINFDAAQTATSKTFYFPIPVGDYTSLELSISNGTETKVLKTKGLAAERSQRYKSTLTLDVVTGDTPVEASSAADATSKLQNSSSVNITIPEDESDPTISLPETSNDGSTTLAFEPIPDGKIVTIQAATNEANVSGNVNISASSNENSNNSFNIQLPKSTVTLNANGETATYNEVTAHTAANTLIIGKGVTVKKLVVKGGNVRVYGVVENIVREGNEDKATVIFVEDGGVIPASIGDDFVVIYDGCTTVSSADQLVVAIADSNITAVVLAKDINLGSTTITRAAGDNAVVVAKQNFTIDGAGKTLTYSGSNRVIDFVNGDVIKNATIKNLTINITSSYCERGINFNNTNGSLLIENVTFEGTAPTYAVNFPGSSDNAKVEIKNSYIRGLIALNVWGENMAINASNTEFVSVDNTEAEGYSAVKLNNDGSTSAEGTIINIEGGKIIARDEKGEPSKATSNATVTGVINVSETTEVVGTLDVEQVAIVDYGTDQFYGMASLQAAIDKVAKDNNGKVRVTKNIELTEGVTIPEGATIEIDLNGKTITATDNTEVNYQLIHNKGTLLVKNGTMKVKATVNSGWNRYSAVIANTVGGNLTVEGVNIEHLGGTDMAYGIDNLTNGKGTYAVTTIENTTVKSTYRAVRQFLNGVEATNELYVKAGAVLEAPNKSIFFHDPSAKANTGKLVVEEGAELKGDVYLFVTAGSTEWPVEVSIASSALVGDSEVVSGNVPEGYAVKLVNGTWTVVK